MVAITTKAVAIIKSNVKISFSAGADPGPFINAI
jgi:hypothetical protein